MIIANNFNFEMELFLYNNQTVTFPNLFSTVALIKGALTDLEIEASTVNTKIDGIHRITKF